MTPDEMNFAGIYAIRHVASGKVYVGQAQNIARRIRQHTSISSQCTYIKNAIQAHGWAEFEVSVLEEVQDFGTFNRREEYWIDALNAADPEFGYNICPTATARRGVVHSPEACAKMSAAKTGRPLSDEHKARIAEGSRNRGAANKRIATMRAANAKRISRTQKAACSNMAQDTTYSTNVRFPGEMKEQMQQAAEEQRRSLNGLIVRAVEIYLQEHNRRRGERTPRLQEAE